jgi:hypothetical protein
VRAFVGLLVGLAGDRPAYNQSDRPVGSCCKDPICKLHVRVFFRVSALNWSAQISVLEFAIYTCMYMSCCFFASVYELLLLSITIFMQ